MKTESVSIEHVFYIFLLSPIHEMWLLWSHKGNAGAVTLVLSVYFDREVLPNPRSADSDHSGLPHHFHTIKNTWQ